MSARRIRRASLALWLVLILAGAGAALGRDEDPDAPWQEEVTAPPAFPREDDLLPFYVSAGTTHRYFIDGRSISVGADGVVRYVLVVRTAGGASNVSFEGIRCDTLGHRYYASGRADGTWIQARSADWKRIENKPVNRYHAALARDYFCPSHLAIRDADEGRMALVRGGHPEAK